MTDKDEHIRVEYYIEDLIELNREKCARLVQGECTNLDCIRRGFGEGPTCQWLQTYSALSDFYSLEQAIEHDR